LYDFDEDNQTHYLVHATWMVKQSLRVVRLLSAAMSLPDCVLYRRLEQVERDAEIAIAAIWRNDLSHLSKMAETEEENS
jgi:hypothetical protein